MHHTVELDEHAAPLARSGWNLAWAATIIIPVALGLLLYASPLASLVSDWEHDEGASYGFLVPPIALYVAYMGRRATLRFRRGPTAEGC